MTRPNTINLLLIALASIATTPAIAQRDNQQLSTIPAIQDSWGDQHRKLVKEATTNADSIQIVLLGDSITRRWTTGAGKALKAERYEPHGVINLGISADGIQHVLWRLENGEMAPLNPKMVLLMIGTNNLRSSSAEEIAYGVWKIVEYIRTHHPETRVLVQAIFPRSRPADRMDKIHQTNTYLSKLDDGQMVKYIDFGSAFLTPDGSLNKTWFTDGLHPEKPEAFKIWADSIQPIVDNWLTLPPVTNVPAPKPPVETPRNSSLIKPKSRNDWLYKFNRFVAETKRTEGHLLFLGDTTLSKWKQVDIDLYKQAYSQYEPAFGAFYANRTENILWQLENMPAENIAPKLVILQLQENLTEGHGSSPEDIFAGVQAIISKIHALYPQANILLEGALPEVRGERVFVTKSIEAYNRMLSQFAQQDSKVYFLDLAELFKNEAALYVPNRIKSTIEAYRKWAEVRQQLVSELMN
jgi:lysophospholipase L1-like esterase